MDTTPIFPIEARTDPNTGMVYPGNSGMLLRDYMAGQALVGQVIGQMLMQSTSVNLDTATLNTMAGASMPINTLTVTTTSYSPYDIADSILSGR